MKSGLNGRTASATTSCQEKGRGVTRSYVVRKNILSPKDSENRDVQIIYKASLVWNMFTRDSGKVIDIFK